MIVPSKEMSYNEAVTFILDRIHGVYSSAFFHCDICQKDIPPKIKVVDNELFFESADSEINTWKKERINKRRICKNCKRIIDEGLKNN